MGVFFFNGVIALTTPSQKKDVQREAVYCLKDDETDVPKVDTHQHIPNRTLVFLKKNFIEI